MRTDRSVPEPRRVEPPCGHFGLCGGCSWQDVAYAEQVRGKAEALAARLGRRVPVRPSPRPYHYRTRMDYVYAWGKLGLRKRGDPRGVLELETCLLPSERAFAAVRAVRASIRRNRIPPYSYVSHKGYLRYVTVREAPVAGELMLTLLTNGTDRSVLPVLEEAAEVAESAVWSVTERRADVSVGAIHEIRGRGWIEETIGPNRYRFGPNSFFQANPWLTADLYEHVGQRVEGRVVDLCCGVGGIGIHAASRARSVLGVDSSDEAIAFAEHNARVNGVSNAKFVAADVRHFLLELDCDVLVVDPPRAGLGAKSVRKIVRAGPRRIVYVSCNPKALAAEIPLFQGYRVSELEGFDLFPQTPHVEVVATLDRM